MVSLFLKLPQIHVNKTYQNYHFSGMASICFRERYITLAIKTFPTARRSQNGKDGKKMYSANRKILLDIFVWQACSGA